MATTTTSVVPIPGAPFGARVTGLDPSNISALDHDLLWDAYQKYHGLLCLSFPQLITAEQLHALTAVFGDNEFAPGRIGGFGRRAADGEQSLSIEAQVAAIRDKGGDPYLAYIGNVDPVTGEPRPTDAKFFGEWEWHTDMSYIPVPPTFSLLHARQIPETGGDTGFCSQVLAAVELPATLRDRVIGMTIKHDSTYTSSGQLRPGMTPPASPIEAEGHPHPILRRVPSTGEQALFLGRRTNAYVPGLSLSDSDALLDELWAHATDPRWCYRHQWQIGEVVIWDNRMMLHMRYPVDESQSRFMWRTQTRGEAVIPVEMAGTPS
jgi:alpha-ketoglutarate-dependent taurine dioxygenase